MMNQIWHIFRKDFRHHWREIAASIALLAAMSWSDIAQWMEPRLAVNAPPLLGLLSQLVVPLVPISWMFLIVRVVQGESLVGDRQFWVTRPYDWKSLLAAKVLFVLTFINLPLFLADLFLLLKAGFSPSAYLVSLLWLQLMWILMIFVPTAALAAVTRSIAQMLLALLFIVLFAIGSSAVASLVPNSGYSSDTGPVYLALVALAAIAVVLLQYSRRKTTLSRWLLVGLGVAALLVLVAAPYRTLIAHDYPLAGGSSAPLQLTLRPPNPLQGTTTYGGNSKLAVHFGFDVSGLPKDSFVLLNGRMLTLTNSQGAHWDSGWEEARLPIYSDQRFVNIDFYMKKEEYDRMKSSPVQAHVLLAFTLYHDKNQRTFSVPPGEFSVPDLGFCTAGITWATFTCRTPLRTANIQMSYQMAASTCPLSKNEIRATAGEMAREFIPGEQPAEFGISPVEIKQLNLYAWQNTDRSNPNACPGTPVTISNPEEAGRSRLELQYDNFTLPDYQIDSRGNIIFGPPH
jgi:hypothetical protein